MERHNRKSREMERESYGEVKNEKRESKKRKQERQKG